MLFKPGHFQDNRVVGQLYSKYYYGFLEVVINIAGDPGIVGDNIFKGSSINYF